MARRPWLSVICLIMVAAASLHAIAFRPARSATTTAGVKEVYFGESDFQEYASASRAAFSRDKRPHTAAVGPTTALRSVALGVRATLLHAALVPLHLLLQSRAAIQERVQDTVLNYATALCEVSCPMDHMRSERMPPRPWLRPKAQQGQRGFFAPLQEHAVKAYIWLLYSAAGTTARLGLATPQPLPPAWLEDAWLPPSLQTADPCNPPSFIVPAFRAVFFVQLTQTVLQLALAVILAVHLWTSWRGTPIDSDAVHAQPQWQHATTQTSQGDESSSLKPLAGKTAGLKGQQGCKSSMTAYPPTMCIDSAVQVSEGKFDCQRTLKAPLLEHGDERC